MFNADGWLNETLKLCTDNLWTYLLLGVLVVCGLYFTVRTRFVQFSMVGEMFRLLGDKPVPRYGGKRPISSFDGVCC